MNNVLPKISVITVNLNALQGLHKTLQSVEALDYPHIEFIVIDGGSVDGSAELIKEHAANIDYWISESDHGIYDAMNKGLARATGEWVNFMNSGDVFYNAQVLSHVFQQDHGDVEVIYGDSIAQYPGFRVMRKASAAEDLWKGMICCHQAMFFRTSRLQSAPYRPRVGFSADYELILRLYLEGLSFRYLPHTITVFDTRGISNQEMTRSAQANLTILGMSRTITHAEKGYHRRFIIKSRITEIMYRVVPDAIIRVLLRWLYRHQVISESTHHE